MWEVSCTFSVLLGVSEGQNVQYNFKKTFKMIQKCSDIFLLHY